MISTEGSLMLDLIVHFQHDTEATLLEQGLTPEVARSRHAEILAKGFVRTSPTELRKIRTDKPGVYVIEVFIVKKSGSGGGA
ncbi:MAG: hypothetical protein WAX38_01345 [Minisyncoccia bacterium]